MSVQLLREHAARQEAQDRPRWERVWELREEGLSVAEITRMLGVSERTISRDVARSRSDEEPSAGSFTAAQMAAIYPDRDRQNWILWQMGVEERER